MKFNTMIRTGVAAVTSLAAALGISACSRDYTAAYVYSISSSTGTISGYGVDYQSGILTQLEGSPFATQFTNPATIVSTPNGKYVYAVSGNQQAAVEPFAVGTDGKIYGEATANLPTGDTYPTAATVDSTSSFLFVTFRYQPQYSLASPGPGGVAVFKINSDGTLGTPTSINLGVAPIAITVTAPVCTSAPLVSGNNSATCTNGQSGNVFVYVIDQETASKSQIIGFSLNSSTGAMALLNGSTCTTTAPTTCTGTKVGTTPSALAADPTGRYLYVTDETTNELYGFAIGSSANTATAGQLSSLNSSPYATGQYPVAVIVDPRGKYVYVANNNGNSVSSYSLNSADGSLGGTASVGNFTTHTGPNCLTIDPALGIYLYTSNNLDSTIDGAQLSPNTGQLTAIATTPFPSGPLPSCLTSVPNGARANQIVYP
jgi:6-phosphogluconolactonase (cycloisomerase 2 family)